MTWRRATVGAFALLTGCSILSGRCLYELRGTTAEGAAQISGADSVFASVQVFEQRDYEPDKNMSWQVRGQSIKGKVASIKLLDQSGNVKYTFPVDAAATSQLSGGFVRQSDGADINGFFDILASGQAKVVIALDSGSSITIPLLTVRRDDWNRPYCS